MDRGACWAAVHGITKESDVNDGLTHTMVSLKRNQPWILIGMTDDEVETPVLWPRDAKS